MPRSSLTRSSLTRSARRRPGRPVRALGRIGAGLIVAGLVVGLAPPYASAVSAAGPAIRFTGGVLAPVVCSSAPDPSTLTVANNTRVVLANFTGADATVDLGTGTPLAVADGAALSVRFKKGEYRVRMVPDCPGMLEVQPAVVSVVRPKGAGDPGSVAVTPSPVGPVASFPPPDTPSSARSSPMDSAEENPSGLIAAPGRATAGPAPVEVGPDVLAAPPVGDRPDGGRARLLAVIATICVFGVTTAIIRAIVAQRTTRSAGTSQHE